MKIISSRFITSAAQLSQCPTSDYPEIALIGRSNVGKSSLINMLTQNKIAKVSVTPGKTKLLNYFLINDSRHLVDLPGYGYAQHSKDKRIDWMDTMQDYLTHRSQLKKVFLLIDGSIPPQKIDLQFIQELDSYEISFDIIITKIDKCNSKQLQKNLSFIKDSVEENTIQAPLFLISSNTKKSGKEDILDYINQIIEIE